jgi:hypothetical protein
MRKFSQINENKINESELESLLKDSGLKYIILHDYYYQSDYFFRDIKDIKDDTKYSKIVIIYPNLEQKSLDISDYYKEPMKFNSSSFYSKLNIDDVQEKYNKIFDIVRKLSSNSPNLIFKDDKIVITLIGENVTKSEINLRDRTLEAKKELYEDLKKFIDETENKHIEVSYSTSRKNLFLTIKKHGSFKVWEDIWGKTIKTLEIQNSNNKGREWMKGIDEIEGLNDVRDNINEKGFYIELINIDNDPGKFEIELIEF